VFWLHYGGSPKYNREYSDIVIAEENLDWITGESDLVPQSTLRRHMYKAANNTPGDTDLGPKELHLMSSSATVWIC
jgi:hypothetical protein